MQASAIEQHNVTEGQFAHHVKVALANLYDQVALQASLLADLLKLEQAPGETMASALRKLLRETLESLRPNPSIPFGEPEWIGYRLLWLRYIHRENQLHVCEELSLSRSTYYRYHRQALKAVTSILWKRYQTARMAKTGQEDVPGSSSLGDMASIRATKLVQGSRREMVDLAELLESVRQTLVPLAEREGIALYVDAPEGLPPVYANLGMLRQAMLSILTKGMELVGAKTVWLIGSQGIATIRALRGKASSASAADQLEELSAFAFAQSVLEAYGGPLSAKSSPEGLLIVFAIPVAKARTILIVDDDNDTIRLYRRWLEAQHHIVHVARTGSQLEEQLAQNRPDLILLDLLMPQWDGWDVLQQIKARPETADIPVIISSVLDQPRLGRALGASTTLHKPITEAKLLQTVMDVLDGEGNLD